MKIINCFYIPSGRNLTIVSLVKKFDSEPLDHWSKIHLVTGNRILTDTLDYQFNIPATLVTGRGKEKGAGERRLTNDMGK